MFFKIIIMINHVKYNGVPGKLTPLVDDVFHRDDREEQVKTSSSTVMVSE